MKYLFSLVITLLIALPSNGQDWEPYEMEAVGTFSFPVLHEVTQEPGYKSIKGHDKGVMYMVSMLDDSDPGIVNSLADLEANYDKLITRMLDLFEGATAIEESYFDNAGIHGVQATIKFHIKGIPRHVKVISYTLGKKQLTFQIVSGSRALLVNDKFGTEMEFKEGLTLEDQFNTIGVEDVIEWAEWLGGVVVFFAIVAWFRKRRKQREALGGVDNVMNR
jgi:hypothetical protein